ncbi:hypothetical protein RUND412_003536 [Rhizina undulata]
MASAHPPQTPHRHSHHPPALRATRPPNLRRRSAPIQQAYQSGAAASPEVITSLVDSLSKLSPSPLHNPSLYGALPIPPLPAHSHNREYDYDYDYGTGKFERGQGYLHPNDAAIAPIVRTVKPQIVPAMYANNEHDHRRGSGHSGVPVGKGGVDIPSYVRNYMNRAASIQDNSCLDARRHSRNSSVSSAKDFKLPNVSSRERMREREKELENQRERELRMSTAGVLTEFDAAADRRRRSVEQMSATREPIPARNSSFRSTPSPSKGPYPAAIVTNHPPLFTPPPMGSPRLPAGISPEEEFESAPAPELPKLRGELIHTHRKSKSKSLPKRPDSLNAQLHVALGSPTPMLARTESKTSKRKSDPQGLSPPSAAFTPVLSPTRVTFPVEPERPSSADSIDDAVDAYLCSPRLSQKLRVPNSTRVISFSEVGDANGFAVFVCVGMGLTRYVTAFYDELALSLGLRLITLDRPGVGESDPIDESERTVLNWPDDVLLICQSLKIHRFSLLAHSAGAIYALATALRMPGHIRGRIHLLAPWIPPSQMEGLISNSGNGGEKASVPTTQRILRALPTPLLKAANSSFMAATSSSLTTSLPKVAGKKKKRVASNSNNVDSSPSQNPSSRPGTSYKPPEDPILAAQEEKERQLSYDVRLTHAIWTLSTRHANPAVDLLVCLERNRPVGFRYVDITKPVVIHHGTRDTRVPMDNIRWLGKTMRRCEVRILQGEGHGLMASAMVMSGVLEEIADEAKRDDAPEPLGTPGGWI